MELKSLSQELIEQLDKIKIRNGDIIERAFRSIEVCRNLLSKLKKEVLRDGFGSVQDEIHFFKTTKQVPLVQLIYFSEIQEALQTRKLPERKYGARPVEKTSLAIQQF